MSNKNLIIFDLDDTIYPEIAFNLSGYKAAARIFFNDFGIDIYPEIKSNFLQGKRKDLFTLVISKHKKNIDEKYIVSRLVAEYRTHSPKIKPYNDFILFMKKNRFKYHFAIITDGISQVQKNKIKALNISHLFEKIVYSNDFGVSKPSEIPYLEVMDFFSVEHKSTLYVADNAIKDFIYPRQSGMHSIQLLNKKENKHLIYKNHKGENADLVCFSYEKLDYLINKIW